MTEEMTFGSLIKTMLALGILFCLLFAAAYLSGVTGMLFQKKTTDATYGLTDTGEQWSKALLQVHLWQGIPGEDPLKEGLLTPFDDTVGNSDAFSLVQVIPGPEHTNVGWENYAEIGYGNYFSTPVLTVKNVSGGKVRAVYEYATWRDEDDPNKFKCALVWSTSDIRVPTSKNAHRPGNLYHPYWYEGRSDTQMDWDGTVENNGMLVLHADGADSFPDPTKMPFNRLYPGGDLMETVCCLIRKSGLLLYALDPDDESHILAEAELLLTSYTNWQDTENGSLSEEQLTIIKQLNARNYAYCTVTMVSYVEEMRIE